MMKKLILILSCLFLSIGLIYSQNITVNGVVVDDAGIEVIGASVVVKGTTTGVATDIDGKFSLNVPSNSTLVFSLVGMKKVEMKATPSMKVVMENDDALLDEVIVVAYGTAKKSQFTGSAAAINADDIKNSQTASISKALSGKMSGVQVTSTSGRPGEDAVIRIRGIGSLNAVNNPLYVVDGVPYEGELNSINQSDIASLTVLKDAAANSLYGARGANGVILITTKGGVIGGTGKPRVTVDARWGGNTRGVPLYDMVDSPSEYYELYWKALRNQQMYAPDLAKPEAEASQIATNNLVSRLGGYNIYNVPNNELVSVNGAFNPNAQLLYRDIWKDELFKTGLRQEYQVGVSGGNDKTQYYLSLGHLGDEGIVVNSDFARTTGRLRLDQQVNNWLKVGGNMAFTRTTAKRTTEDDTAGINMFYAVQTIAPIYPLYEYDANGNRMYEADGTPIYDFGAGDHNSSHIRPISGQSNPLASQTLDKDTDKTNFFSGQVYAEVRFLKDFKLTTNMRLDNTDTYNSSYINGIYGQYAADRGISYKNTTRLQSLNTQQLLTWAKQFDLHSVDVLVGHEYYKHKRNYASASRRTFYDPNNTELDGAIASPNVNSYDTNYLLDSYLSRVQYDYDTKYFASFSFRTDGSSRFHKDERWGKFWSVGGSWLLNKENFMSSVKWVDELKFKISFGTQGNDNLYGYSTKARALKSVSPWANQYVVKDNGDNVALEAYHVGNKKLTWEKSNSFNTGIEFAVLKNRVYGGIEFFNRKTSDQLHNRTVPLSAGYASYPDNIGSTTNRGLEFEVTGELVRSQDLKWTVSLNMTHYKNKINTLPEEIREDGMSAGLFWYREGHSMYDYYLKEYAGVNEKGQSMWWKDGEVDGRPTRVTTTDYNAADRYYQGSALPDVYGGLSTSLTWKGFDLAVQTAFQLGGTGYDSNYMGMMGAGSPGRAWHKDIRSNWSEDNMNTNVPRLQNGEVFTNSTYSTRWLVSSDYFSLQNVTLGYTLPRQLLMNTGINSIRVYGTAENLALFSKRKGYDPREAVTGVNAAGRYQPIRTISGGVSLEF